MNVEVLCHGGLIRLISVQAIYHPGAWANQGEPDMNASKLTPFPQHCLEFGLLLGQWPFPHGQEASFSLADSESNKPVANLLEVTNLQDACAYTPHQARHTTGLTWHSTQWKCMTVKS